ncbi:Fc.00g075980.m01.CDS01 [Cosmosporella sp. VM-42]
MVYCGKPSKGCSNCRERKIRCDQREPGCGQCEKRQQACPGYRNLVDLSFRDETFHVIKKASNSRSRNHSRTARAHRKRAVSGGPTSPSPTPSSRPVPSPGLLHPPVPAGFTPGSSSRPSPSSSPSDGSLESLDDVNGEDEVGEASKDAVPPVPLSPSFQERGTAFFFSRYVATDNGCHQNYGFIYDIWKPPDPATESVVDCVTASMTAVGLAGLSQLTGCRETMNQARQSYGTALQLTNAALRDPNEAVKDSTMLAVLILGSYEFISGRCPQTMRAWQDHVNGAAALASLRGSAQFRTKAGVRMFLMLCHSVLISCIQSGLPMPQAMVDLRKELQHLQDDDSPAWRVADPIYRALQVRYDIKIGKLNNVDEIVRKLSDIDDEFAHLLSELPPSWQYHRVQLTRPDPRVLGRCCHVYPGLLQATTWNSVRAIRMLVLETILEQLCSGPKAPGQTSLPYHYQVQLAKTTQLLEMLSEAIVASIPQHFGVVSFRDVHAPAAKGATVSVSAKDQPHHISSPRSASESQPERQSVSSDLGTPTLLDPTQSQGKGGNAERFMTLASASHTVIWPLYILGMSSSCSPETKQYATGRLHAIHKETGLEQARVVANMLQAKGESLTRRSAPLSKLPRLREEALPATV